MIRRKLMKAAWTIGISAFLLLAVGFDAFGADPFDWKRYKGQTVVAGFETLPYYKFVQSIIGEFETLTGIRVLMDIIPEQQMRQKKVIELESRSGSLDVIGMAMHVEKTLIDEANWYVPLDDFIRNPSLTPPDFNWPDFYPGSVNWVTSKGGKIMGIPGQFGGDGLFYRKDILKEKGVAVPKTFAELEEAVKRLHDPPRLYGFVARGLKNANIPIWNGIMVHLGERLQDEAGNVFTTTPLAIEAAKMYARLMKYAPPGAIGYNWYECQSMFIQGRAAFWYDGVTNNAGPVEDAAKSKVAGKTGYTALLGPGGKPMAESAQSAMAINPYSQKKEPAWYFIHWASSAPVQLRSLLAGTGMPRKSLYLTKEFRSATHMPEDWLSFMQGYMSGETNVVPMVPVIKRVSEYRDIFGVALTKAIEGGDVATLLKEASEEFTKMK